MSKAIILVAFGSANLEGIKKSIGLLESDLNKYFGDEYKVIKAFTSNKIINLLKERHDYVIPHLSKVLFNLVNNGYEEVIIQPLHIISNSGIREIEEIVEEYKYSMKKLIISKTLFTDNSEKLLEESYQIANIICEDLDNSNLLLVGHGSKRNSNNLYYVIEDAVKKIYNNNVYMITLEGEKSLDTIIENLERDNIKNIVLKCLFIIPGKHVIEDIACGENSLVEKLRKKNISVFMGKDSLLKYEKIRSLYISNIKRYTNK